MDCGVSTVTIDGSASSDPDPVDQERGLSFEWTSPTGSHIPEGFETAAMFDVDVEDLLPGANVYNLKVTDNGVCPGGVMYDDTGTVTIPVDPDVAAPTINSLAPDPALLWPPNHEMIPVTLTVDATDECGDVSCRIVDVMHSDVPETGNGANTFPDWEYDGEPVLAPGALKPWPSATNISRSCTSFQGARSPLACPELAEGAYRILCLRFVHLVRRDHEHDSQGTQDSIRVGG